MIPVIPIGTVAPDFSLKDHNNEDFHLYDVKGQKVLLSFHPLAWTQVCADQMKSLESNFDRFLKLNTLPVGLSIDSRQSKNAWAKELNISRLRLLADFWLHGAVANSFGVFRDKDGISERANIIIDENRKIIWGKTYPLSQLPDIEEVLAALAV